MPVTFLNLDAVSGKCAGNCGPATAQMITRGGFVQSEAGPVPNGWLTSPAELARQITSGGLAGYAPFAFEEPAEESAPYAATAAILQSIRGGHPAAAAIHHACHWVACDGFAFLPNHKDGVCGLTGVAILDPGVAGKREARPFGIVLEPRRFVWTETWMTACLTAMDNTDPQCAGDHNRVHIVAAAGCGPGSFVPLRVKPNAAGPLLDETAIRSRVPAALAPHWGDLAEIFGLPAADGWSLKSVTIVPDEAGDGRWSRIHFATGLPGRELVVVASTKPPLEDADGLCLRSAGILAPAPGFSSPPAMEALGPPSFRSPIEKPSGPPPPSTIHIEAA